MNAAPPQRPCPAGCDTAYVPLTRVRDTAIWRCTTCGLATWAWPDFDPTAFYGASYWQSDDATRGYADYHSLAGALAHTNRRRLARVRRLLPGATECPRLLDAGCGPGYFVQAAKEAGFDATGLEVSAAAVAYAREHLHLPVQQGGIDADALADGPYDVITMWDVIEHLPDPAAALAAAGDALRPGGVLMLSTGDVTSLAARLSGRRWHLYNLPEHLWFFSPESLARVLRRAGLDPLARRYEVCWYPLRYLVERLEAMAGRGHRLSTHLGPIGRIPLPATLADIITQSARRPLADGVAAEAPASAAHD